LRNLKNITKFNQIKSLAVPKNLEKTLLIFILIIISLFSLTLDIPIISIWESANLYPALQPAKTPDILFAINQGADTSGYWGPKGYFFLRASRLIANIWGYDLTTLRILPMIYGIISLVLLYRIMVRTTNYRAAAIASLILATNSPFIVFQHSLLPQIFTLMAFLWCVDRYQILIQLNTIFTAFLFGISCSVLAVGYLPGRILMLLILGYYASNELNVFKNILKNGIVSALSVRTKGTVIALVSMILTLATYPKNMGVLFNKKFIFSPLGEYATSSTDALTNIVINSQYFLKFFILGQNKNQFLIDIVNSIAFPIENIIILIFASLGILAAIKNITRVHYRFLLVLFSIYSGAILLSMTFPDRPFANSTTLSNYRVFLLAPMVAIFAATFMAGIFNFLECKIGWKAAAALCVIFSIGIAWQRTALNIKKQNNFNEHLQSYNFNFERNPNRNDINSIKPLIDQPLIRQNLLDQIYFWHLAKYLTSKISILEKGKTKTLYLNQDKYMPMFYKGGGRIPNGRGPTSSFLNLYTTIYLRENLNDVGFIVQKNSTFGERISFKNRLTSWLSRKFNLAGAKSTITINISKAQLTCGDFKVLGSSLSRPSYLLVSTESESSIAKCFKTN